MEMDEKLKQPFQGHLVKFTNVVKGWQTRWFVLNPEYGTLHYYLVSINLFFPLNFPIYAPCFQGSLHLP